MVPSSSLAAAPGNRVLSITRTFAAPRELVFKVWTQPEHLVRWWGPKGFTTPSCRMEPRPGGSYRTVIRSAEGKEHCMCGTFREVVPPERLVMTFAWEDEQGEPGHETLVTVTFEDVAGQTRLTFEHGVFQSVEERDSHLGGWTGFMERLDDYLASSDAAVP
jgi:uncharacterized protein YndB with AHSA1/START domain